MRDMDSAGFLTVPWYAAPDATMVRTEGQPSLPPKKKGTLQPASVNVFPDQRKGRTRGYHGDLFQRAARASASGLQPSTIRPSTPATRKKHFELARVALVKVEIGMLCR